jgi:galactokinase
MPPTPSATATIPPNVQSLIVKARDLFERTFGADDDDDYDDDDDRADLPLHCASAPGRVNLIGEHTDYTGGYVLPLAIDHNTVCYGRGDIVARTDPGAAATRCRVVSSTTTTGRDDSSVVVEFFADRSSTPSTTDDEKWANYVRGVVLQYLPDLPDDETFVLDVAVAGDVPLGSGLSSSASLEVATAVFLECVMDRRRRGVAYSSYGGSGRDPEGTMSAKEVAKERAIRCQRAENVFCGVPCGECLLFTRDVLPRDC